MSGDLFRNISSLLIQLVILNEHDSTAISIKYDKRDRNTLLLLAMHSLTADPICLQSIKTPQNK